MGCEATLPSTLFWQPTPLYTIIKEGRGVDEEGGVGAKMRGEGQTPEEKEAGREGVGRVEG